MQTAKSRIWTPAAVSTYYDDKHYVTSTFFGKIKKMLLDLCEKGNGQICIYVCMCARLRIRVNIKKTMCSEDLFIYI